MKKQNVARGGPKQKISKQQARGAAQKILPTSR